MAHTIHLYTSARHDPKGTQITAWWRWGGNCEGLRRAELFTGHILTLWNCAAREYITGLEGYFWLSPKILSGISWVLLCFLIFILCVWIFCLCMHLCIVCTPNAHRGQKRASDPPEQMATDCLMGAKIDHWFSARAASVFKCWAVSLAPINIFKN